jgi:hypothetical protein
MDPLERETVLKTAILAPVTHAQQVAVRDWLQSVLSLSVLEGEGGFYSDLSLSDINPAPALYGSDCK